jgi:hypothetical protein
MFPSSLTYTDFNLLFLDERKENIGSELLGVNFSCEKLGEILI